MPGARLDESPQRAATYTDAFSRALLAAAEEDPRIVALTAAMPGPTGLLAFQARFPDRFFDVGIAEQHEVTSAAGMAMAGLRPVVAVYSTFWSRAFDQANLDVGLHGCPVVFVLDRAGITGDDGPSHHGILDLALALSIPGMTVFAPSSAEEVEPMLRTALELPGPVAPSACPRRAPRHVDPGDVGCGLEARQLRAGDGSVCLLGVGKTVAACLNAADELAERGDRRHGVGRAGGLARPTSPCSPTRPATGSWSRRRTACATAAPAPSSSTPWRRRSSRPAFAGAGHAGPGRPAPVPRPGQGGRHPGQPRPRRRRHRRERPPGPARGPGRRPPTRQPGGRRDVGRSTRDGSARPGWRRSAARSR